MCFIPLCYLCFLPFKLKLTLIFSNRAVYITRRPRASPTFYTRNWLLRCRAERASMGRRWRFSASIGALIYKLVLWQVTISFRGGMYSIWHSHGRVGPTPWTQGSVGEGVFVERDYTKSAWFGRRGFDGRFLIVCRFVCLVTKHTAASPDTHTHTHFGAGL